MLDMYSPPTFWILFLDKPYRVPQLKMASVSFIVMAEDSSLKPLGDMELLLTSSLIKNLQFFRDLARMIIPASLRLFLLRSMQERRLCYSWLYNAIYPAKYLANSRPSPICVSTSFLLILMVLMVCLNFWNYGTFSIWSSFKSNLLSLHFLMNSWTISLSLRTHILSLLTLYIAIVWQDLWKRPFVARFNFYLFVGVLKMLEMLNCSRFNTTEGLNNPLI